MSLLSSHIAPVVVINVGNACAYGFQVLLARWLPPAEVGAFNALLSTVTLIAAPASVIPLAVTRIMPLLKDRLGEAALLVLSRAPASAALAGCGLIMALTLLASPIVGELYDVPAGLRSCMVRRADGLDVAYPVAADGSRRRAATSPWLCVLGACRS